MNCHVIHYNRRSACPSVDVAAHPPSGAASKTSASLRAAEWPSSVPKSNNREIYFPTQRGRSGRFNLFDGVKIYNRGRLLLFKSTRPLNCLTVAPNLTTAIKKCHVQTHYSHIPCSRCAFRQLYFNKEKNLS